MTRTDVVKLRIHTRERRYILPPDTDIEALLRSRGEPLEYVVGRPETLITTVYFDTQEGTWSKGLSQTKIRARSYQNPEEWWFELKRRTGTRVDKWRKPMTVELVAATLAGGDRWKPVRRAAADRPLLPIFAVQCRRTSFEWAGLRVTIDRDLTFFQATPEEPLELGPRLGHLKGVVLEVKVEGNTPDWLEEKVKGRLASGYSKSRYALALLAGNKRPYLVVDQPVETPVVPKGKRRVTPVTSKLNGSGSS